MSDCIFCKIAQKEIKTNIIFENEFAVAFNDINPQAPTHVLVIPKQHFDSLSEMNDHELIGKLMLVVKELATTLKLDKGYRVVVNTGNDGGQTVHHLHIHILGGRQLLWPPG